MEEMEEMEEEDGEKMVEMAVETSRAVSRNFVCLLHGFYDLQCFTLQ